MFIWDGFRLNESYSELATPTCTRAARAVILPGGEPTRDGGFAVVSNGSLSRPTFKTPREQYTPLISYFQFRTTMSCFLRRFLFLSVFLVSAGWCCEDRMHIAVVFDIDSNDAFYFVQQVKTEIPVSALCLYII